MAQNATQQVSPTTTAWTLDAAHSRAEFSVRHLMIMNVRGSLPIRSARIEMAGDDLQNATLEAELDAAGIHTGATDRDAHLRSADFLDVENHAAVRFHAAGIERIDDARYRVAGDLTLRGVTRPVVLDVEETGRTKDPWGHERVGLVATTTLDRSQFGLTWNMALETGGVVVGDKVKVELTLAFLKAQ